MNSSPVDHPNFENNPEQWWKITWFVRDKYIECQVQAPNGTYAEVFSKQSLMRDGIALNRLSHIKTEKISEPSEYVG